ncbi:MAG: CehA/McbA family metallohydrolase [Christensenellales bacterium]|jgi:hypothetical protein|nr:CehA/McbA family metallohydrolase [Clostridiales bacterium]
MESLRIEYRIEKDQEKKYLLLSFEVPPNVERMDIKYSYEGDKANSRVTEQQKNVIDFGLLDEKGDDVGTRGSDVREVSISPCCSTPGFKKKEINPGKWQIIVGAYQIRPEGVTVYYDIKFYFKRLRWLKGDTHTHTNHSDGKLTREQLVKKAAKKGLDFIIITDHNNNLEGISLPQHEGATVIKGVELTNYRGHMNLFGLDKPYDGSFAVNSLEEFKQRNRQAKERGAIQVLNHPMCSLCPWLFEFEGIIYDAVEVWNGPMRKDNLKAVKWWDDQLKQGRRLPAIGGSDYHRDFYITDLLASPTLCVYADCNSQDAILKAIKEGACVLKNSPSSTMIDMRVGEAYVGQQVEFKEGLQVKISVSGMKKGHKLKVIDGGGCFHEFTAPRRGDFNISVPLRQKGYVRCEIEYNKNLFQKLLHKIGLFFFLRKEAYEKVPPLLYAITNPIYLV